MRARKKRGRGVDRGSQAWGPATHPRLQGGALGAGRCRDAGCPQPPSGSKPRRRRSLPAEPARLRPSAPNRSVTLLFSCSTVLCRPAPRSTVWGRVMRIAASKVSVLAPKRRRHSRPPAIPPPPPEATTAGAAAQPPFGSDLDLKGVGARNTRWPPQVGGTQRGTNLP